MLDINYNPLAMDDGVCCPGPIGPEPEGDFVLKVPEGTYEVTGSRYPLLRLVVEVMKHRTWHFLRGEGFRD